jgi:ectoine hydroxylase-related dioxygenase (phytanoyl-CoA dioxygenase family)
VADAAAAETGSGGFGARSIVGQYPGMPAVHGAPAAAAAAEKRDQGPFEHWHIDGMDRDVVAPFTLLCGVFLSDTLEDGCGQLTVYPRSHLTLGSLISERGAQVVAATGPRPPLPGSQPLQLKVRAGDVVFAHPLLAHRVGINYSTQVRHALFFRLAHAEHTRLRERVPADLWVECEGLRAAASGVGLKI